MAGAGRAAQVKPTQTIAALHIVVATVRLLCLARKTKGAVKWFAKVAVLRRHSKPQCSRSNQEKTGKLPVPRVAGKACRAREDAGVAAAALQA